MRGFGFVAAEAGHGVDANTPLVFNRFHLTKTENAERLHPSQVGLIGPTT